VRYLLDVHAVLAAIIANHPQHSIADRWLTGKQLALCPLSELGFLRISTHPKAYHFSTTVAKQALKSFVATHKPEFVPADFSAVGLNAGSSDAVTDIYLASLAARHHMKLATLDTGIKHRSVEVMV
jgi:predicted nucleic acid-binding protein